MKRFLLAFASLLVIVTVMLSFASCDNSNTSADEVKHEHTFSTYWIADSINHWHEAICESTNCNSAKKDVASHTFEAGKCSVCNYVPVHEHSYDNACDDECNVCTSKRTPEHIYDNACDTTCNSCGAKRAIVHTPEADDYDCTTPTHCVVCGEETSAAPAKEHVFTNSCDTDCNNFACNFTRATEHTYENNCDADCDVCGANRKPADHVYDNTCDTTCNECGDVRSITHTPAADDKNCTTPTLCSVCNAELQAAPKAEHAYDNVCDASCNNEGCEYTRIPHEYDNNCDADCNECGEVRIPADHVYGDDNICDECGLGSASKPLDFSIPGTLNLSYKPGADNAAVWYKFTTKGKVTIGVTLSANTVMGYGTSTSNMAATNGTDTYVEFTLTADTTYYVNFSTKDNTEAAITAEVKCYALVNKIEDITFPNTGYSLGSDGQLKEDANYCVTNFIDISNCEHILRVNTGTTKFSVISFAMYDENKNFITMAPYVGVNYEFMPFDYYYANNEYNYCYYYNLTTTTGNVKYIRLYTETKYIKNADQSQNVFNFKFVSKDADKVELPLYGKEIINFGDSIFGNNNTATGVSNQLKLNTGAYVYNCAFGGTRAHPRSEGGSTESYRPFDMKNLVNAIISKDFSAQDAALTPDSSGKVFNSRYPAMLERIKNLEFTNQIVTINHGTNDWTGGTSIANYKETLKYIINQLKTNYPDLHIILISPTWRCTLENDVYVPGGNDTLAYGNGTNHDFAVAMGEVAEEMDVDFINCYDIGINASNASDYFDGNDGTHHNAAGRALLAKYIANELIKILK